MNDLPDPDLDELASAVLDGEPVDDPRAASAEVAARAAEFRMVADRLRDVAPAPADVRARAVAAALRAAEQPVAVTAPPRPARAVRTGSRWWIGVAAAASVAALAGVVVSGGLGGDDRDESTAIDDAAVVEATEETTAAASDATVSGEMTMAAPAEESAADTAATGGAATDAASETIVEGADRRDVELLVGPDAVTAFATQPPGDGDVAESGSAVCTDVAPGTVVGEARWAPDAATPPVDVVVVRDVDDDVVRVLDAATCDVLTVAPLD